MNIPGILRLIGLTVVLPVVICSCSGTKHVPEDRHLLGGYKLQVDNPGIDRKELSNYVKPRPNKKILGLRFHMGLYNLSGKKGETVLNSWLRGIGEEPVLFDEFDSEKNLRQIRLYLRNKGYYYPEVDDTVRFKQKKAIVEYEVTTGDPYRIRNIDYSFGDTALRSLVLEDTMNSVIGKGDPFDVDLLEQERGRIERKMKQSGYFNFDRDYIYYRVDTLRKELVVDLFVEIRQYLLRMSSGSYIQVPHGKYRISQVKIYPDFDTRLAFADPEAYRGRLDRMDYEGFAFLYHDRLRTDPTVITQSVFIFPGSLYRIENVEQTYKHLSSLRIFRMVNIEFVETDTTAPGGKDCCWLDCHIQMAPMTLQNYTVELTGTNSSGNIGVAGNLNYQHRNLFGGAENFTFSIKGALETLRESYARGFGNMVELGAESRIIVPKFLLPFKHESFIRRFNPKTSLTLAYNYQRRPDYTRTIANTGFGYVWRGNSFNTHYVNPIEINLVHLPYKTASFENYIRDTYLQYTFEDKLIQAVSYSFVYNNQDINKPSDFAYLRYHAETSGLLLSSGSRMLGKPNEMERYELLGTEFSQYLKSDVDLRFTNVLNDFSSVVYRVFAGAAYPYGNSIAMPFEKQYFGGGANSLRAWRVRDLGPGSYQENPGAKSSYPNKTADIKLEGNFEYRFKLFWLLEGALFLDAGNIWAISGEDDREGALFEWDDFYREIAIGTGFGARLDFSFFIFRLDLGIKVKDPAMQEGERWILAHRGYQGKDFQLNLGIGYPF